MDSRSYLVAAAVCEIAIARTPINSQELTARLHISRRRIEPYLQLLTRAGIVGASRGPKGGYFLKHALAELTVRDVLAAINRGDCIPERPPLAKKIAIAVEDSLNRVMLLDIVNQAQATGGLDGANVIDGSTANPG
jgi:DNA-binding IscR family transcriptional regulator